VIASAETWADLQSFGRTPVLPKCCHIREKLQLRPSLCGMQYLRSHVEIDCSELMHNQIPRLYPIELIFAYILRIKLNFALFEITRRRWLLS